VADKRGGRLSLVEQIEAQVDEGHAQVEARRRAVLLEITPERPPVEIVLLPSLCVGSRQSEAI
jgi:hypothetical protein